MKHAKRVIGMMGFIVVSISGILIFNHTTIAQNKRIKSIGYHTISQNGHGMVKEFKLRDGYPVNENGETYGAIRKDSFLEPDLQLTSSGGYVKKSDLDDNVQTLEEALLQNGRAKRGRKIPLYKSDGKTVVGEFYLGGEE